MDGGEGDSMRRMMILTSYGDNFQNKAIISKTMMRFRPIAPKPTSGDSIHGGASSLDSKNALISKTRTKRKYVRVRRYNRKKTKQIMETDDDKNNDSASTMTLTTTTTTLQLLPEVVDSLGLASTGSQPSDSVTYRTVIENQAERPSYSYWNRNGKGENDIVDIRISDPADENIWRRVGAVELWVTVECVTDKSSCMDLEVQDLGRTDEERVNNLEEDTCPGFISDGLNRVKWLNKAFKRMIRQRKKRKNGNGNGSSSDSESQPQLQGENDEIIAGIWLISKPNLVNWNKRFTCQIKLQYKWGMMMEMDKDSKELVPCDVWTMDGGGFAWKLDVKAALTLGPPSLHDH